MRLEKFKRRELWREMSKIIKDRPLNGLVLLLVNSIHKLNYVNNHEVSLTIVVTQDNVRIRQNSLPINL